MKQVKKYIWVAVLLIVFTVMEEWNSYATNFGTTHPEDWREYIFMLVLAFAAYLATNLSFSYCSKRMTAYGNTTISVTAFFVGALLFYCFYLVFHHLNLRLFYPSAGWPTRIWINGFYMTFITYLPISIFCLLLLHQQRINTLQYDLQEREKAIQQKELQFLNRQLDHHFLFNNFHFLSNLAEQRDDRTIAFTRKMAMLYRYVTKYAKEEVVSLQEELQFARDYLDIMEYRFPGQFHLTVYHETPAPLTTLYVMPGALQLLVENVIKHNEVPAGSSLSISLYINDDILTVHNAIHPKQFRHESLGLGLKHLSDFYILRWNKQLTIRQEQDHFSVALPLIQLAA